MTVRFAVRHRTTYRYSRPMADGYTVAHLLPRNTPTQAVESAAVQVSPQPDEVEELIDAFGNRLLRIGIHSPHDHLELISTCTVDVSSPAAIPAASQPWEQVARSGQAMVGALVDDVGPFLAHTSSTPPLAVLCDVTAEVFQPDRPMVEVVLALSSLIFREFRFDSAFSDVSTPIDDVVRERRGVCQDFAHLAVACLRSRGLAARYVSGYIETTPPAGEPKLTGSDASHAWCSVWVPDHGWLDMDPTNDQVPPQRHVTVAWGRDYFDVTPVRGVVVGPSATQSLEVGVDVTAQDMPFTGVSENR
jgi:transglutaminase-like putative cysteine protease